MNIETRGEMQRREGGLPDWSRPLRRDDSGEFLFYGLPISQGDLSAFIKNNPDLWADLADTPTTPDTLA